MTDAHDDIYAKATRPTPPLPRWRTDPSSSKEKADLVEYCTRLERVVLYYQEIQSKSWSFFRALQRGDKHAGDITEFLSTLPWINTGGSLGVIQHGEEENNTLV